MTQSSATSPTLVKSADRVLDIFELLAGIPNGLTVSEISSELGFARSSTHGLVHTLYSRGYLAQDDDRHFSLGVRLVQLGLNVVDRLELRSVARPLLERLVESTHDTALLVVPQRGELLYVDKVLSGTRDVRTDPRMSMDRPMHCTSLGKALLAALDDELVSELFRGQSLAGVTEFSITDIGELIADLMLTRERTYSLDRQEAVLGVWCVGAPIRDHKDRLIAAISLSTIREFFDPVTSGPLVSAVAVEISRAMGWEGDASTLYVPVPGSETFLLDERQLAKVGSHGPR